MKFGKILLSSAIALTVAGTVTAEPTRGFWIEQGSVAEKGAASVDLSLNGEYYSGAARLGLGKAELVLGTSKSDNADHSEAVLKLGMPALQQLSELNHSWSVYGGFSVASFDRDAPNKDAHHANFIGGAAFTGKIDALEFTVAPELVVNINNKKDSRAYDDESDTYLNIGLGGYFDLGQTEYGRFKPGAELLVTTQDGVDNMFIAGVRWEFNERLTLDVLPVKIGNDDDLSLPGQLRLNAKF
ncbi:MAG: hypothetical protein WAO12_08045 [Venatoribacter sp.]